MELNLPPLADRSGLPDALRVLLATYPRADWAGHENYQGLLSFWLERHVMFRNLLGVLREDASACVDKSMDPQAYAARLRRYGTVFLRELQGHHQIEDQHYFPKLVGFEASLVRGFDILDADHHALDARLGGFAERANGVLQGQEIGPLLDDITRLETLLNRHLLDEEDLIVPVVLKHGPDRIG